MTETTEKKAKLLEVLLSKLTELDDYRDSARLTYTLVEVLFLTFCGSICNCQSYEEIADFGELKIKWKSSSRILCSRHRVTSRRNS